MNIIGKTGGETTSFIAFLTLSMLLVSLVTAASNGAVDNEQHIAASNSSSPSTRSLGRVVPSAMTTHVSLRAQIDECLDAGPVILFFYADWCPFCRQQLPLLDAVEKQYAHELAFIRINIDERPNDAEAFGVRELPTILVITGKSNGGYIVHEISNFDEFTMPREAIAPDMRQDPPGVKVAAGDITCNSCDDCTEKLVSGLYGTVILAQDIGNRTGNCINFSANNATFDCSGHIIGGDLPADPFGVDYGIKVTGKNNVIKNCQVAFFWYGIWLDNAKFNTIIQNNVGFNAYSGLALVNSINTYITANTILFNSYGLALINSSDTTVDSNVVCGNLVADIWQEFSTDNSGTNNTCYTTHNWNDTGTVDCTYLCCIVPYDNMLIDKDTVLCPGEYLLNDSGNPGVIIINNSDITLDCNHASLIGNGSGIGIYNVGHDNVTLINCNISHDNEGIKLGNVGYNNLIGNIANLNNYYGISLDFSSNNNLSGNTASNNALGILLNSFSNDNTLAGNIANVNNYYGIELDSSSNSNTLTGNIATSNKLNGIYLSSSSHSTLAVNNASNNYYGIYLDYSSTNNTLTDNTASNNAIGIFLKSFSNDNTLMSNIANSNNYYGIALESSSTNNLTGNTANSNNYYGILLESSSTNNLTGNTVNSNNDYGILLSYSSNNTLTDNTANLNNEYGIYLFSSSNNTLTGNTAANNEYGIYLSSSNNTLAGNTANSNHNRGILLFSASTNSLTGNTVSNNYVGIHLYNSSNNSLTGNTVSNNSYTGIYQYYSSDNLIYNNYFNNTNNAWDDGNNSWNISKTSGTNIIGGSWLGGNYWSDYAGKDTDGDGLGNTLLPYNSAGAIQNGGDWLPLVAAPFFPFSLDLVTGLNLISLPINDPTITTASSLAAKLGSNCTEVVTFNAAEQQLQSYVAGVPLNNFAIVGGEGYFVNLNHPTSVLLTGSGWPSPFNVSLVPGLNLIGMPVNDTAVTTASTLAAKIGGSCQEVVNWESGTQSYESYVTGVPLNNFAIRAGDGYFVNVVNQTEVIFEGDPWDENS